MGDIDVDEEGLNLVGQGAAGRGRGRDRDKKNDPYKGAPGPEDVWNSRDWRPCRWKKEVGCDGKHFNRDCKKKRSAVAAATADSARGAAAQQQPSEHNASIIQLVLDGASGQPDTVSLGGARGQVARGGNDAARRLSAMGLLPLDPEEFAYAEEKYDSTSIHSSLSSSVGCASELNQCPPTRGPSCTHREN